MLSCLHGSWQFFCFSLTGSVFLKKNEKKIFNRFYRASSHRETNKEGSGIGLSIAKLLVSNLKGEICVNSKYQKESTFSIYIPKK